MSEPCTRCGATEGLDLVTHLYDHPEMFPTNAGRLFIYCENCRSEMRGGIGLSIPIEAVTESTLFEIYRLGRTASPPEAAARMVFGVASPGLLDALTRASREGGWSFHEEWPAPGDPDY